MSDAGKLPPFKHKYFWTNTSCFEDDAKLLRHVGEDRIILDTCIFYPGGGGQPCDTGFLTATGHRLDIVATEEEPDGAIILRTLEQITDEFSVGSSAIPRALGSNPLFFF